VFLAHLNMFSGVFEHVSGVFEHVSGAFEHVSDAFFNRISHTT